MNRILSAVNYLYRVETLTAMKNFFCTKLSGNKSSSGKRLAHLLPFLAIFLLSSLQNHATHIVGGEIYYTLLNNEWEYEIVLKVYRDCGPTNTQNTGFDNPAAIGIFDSDGDLIMNIEVSLADAEVVEIPTELENPCLAVPPDICVERVIYHAFVTLPPIPGGYDLVYQRCCRNPSITNIDAPEQSGATFTTQIPDVTLFGANSCPQFVNFPPSILCTNEEFVFDHSAVDVDGDSLVYVLCDPLLGADALVPQPNPPMPPPFLPVTWNSGYSASYPISSNPAFELNEISGLLTGTPDLLGQFVVGVCVQEYRNGILMTSTNRDFQFNVAFCSSGFLAQIALPEPCNGLSIQFENNSDEASSFFWDFGIEDSDSDTSAIPEPVFTFPASGWYDVMLLINAGSPCADSSIVNVPVFAPLEAEILPSGPVCENGTWTYNFIANGNYASGDSFEWQFGDGSPSSSDLEFPPAISFVVGGTQNILLTINNGACSVDETLSIEVPDLPYADIAPQQVFCGGLTLDFAIASTTANSFLWDFGDIQIGDNSSDETPSYTYGSYGTYLVTLTANPGSLCSYIDQQEFILLPPDPIEELYIIAEPDICDSLPTISVMWYGTGADEVEWGFGDGESSNESTTQYVYDANGNYTVSLTVSNELCDYEEYFEEDISIGFGPITDELLIPNIFTPSGDTKNEHFRMFYKNEDIVLPFGKTLFDYMDLYHMKIYDRWGVLVFDSESNSLHMWDGDFHGETSEGVYYYVLDYKRKCLDQTVQNREGYFSLLRKTK